MRIQRLLHALLSEAGRGEPQRRQLCSRGSGEQHQHATGQTGGIPPCSIIQTCLKQLSAYIKKHNADLAADSTKIFLEGCWRQGCYVGDIHATGSFLKDKRPNMTFRGLLCMYFQNIKTSTAFYGQTGLEVFQSGP